jgi:hypothetical protein
MTAEIVNLRRARKSAARDSEARVAAANRARFGQPKAERDAVRREADRAARTLDGNRVVRDGDGGQKDHGA